MIVYMIKSCYLLTPNVCQTCQRPWFSSSPTSTASAKNFVVSICIQSLILHVSLPWIKNCVAVKIAPTHRNQGLSNDAFSVYIVAPCQQKLVLKFQEIPEDPVLDSNLRLNNRARKLGQTRYTLQLANGSRSKVRAVHKFEVIEWDEQWALAYQLWFLFSHKILKAQSSESAWICYSEINYITKSRRYLLVRNKTTVESRFQNSAQLN